MLCHSYKLKLKVKRHILKCKTNNSVFKSTPYFLTLVTLTQKLSPQLEGGTA